MAIVLFSASIERSNIVVCSIANLGIQACDKCFHINRESAFSAHIDGRNQLRKACSDVSINSSPHIPGVSTKRELAEGVLAIVRAICGLAVVMKPNLEFESVGA